MNIVKRLPLIQKLRTLYYRTDIGFIDAKNLISWSVLCHMSFFSLEKVATFSVPNAFKLVEYQENNFVKNDDLLTLLMKCF